MQGSDEVRPVPSCYTQEWSAVILNWVLWDAVNFPGWSAPDFAESAKLLIILHFRCDERSFVKRSIAFHLGNRGAWVVYGNGRMALGRAPGARIHLQSQKLALVCHRIRPISSSPSVSWERSAFSVHSTILWPIVTKPSTIGSPPIIWCMATVFKHGNTGSSQASHHSDPSS